MSVVTVPQVPRSEGYWRQEAHMIVWQYLYTSLLGTTENHGNTEITEAMIFVKCHDFDKMLFLTKMPWFYVFLEEFFVFNYHMLKYNVWF